MITAEKLSSILNTLDRLVSESSEDEYKSMVQDSISGQLAAKGAPGFLQAKGLDKDQQFMAWYNNAAAGYALGTPEEGVPNSWKEASGRLTEFHKFFNRCLDVFNGNQNQIKAFVAMCSGRSGTMLGTGTEVSADLDKTLEKVVHLKEQFDKADSLGKENGRMMKRVILNNIRDNPNLFSPDLLDRAVEARTSIQMVSLKKMKSTSPKEYILNALKDALQECESQIESIMGDAASGKGMVNPKEMRRHVQKLAIQCAVAFFDKEDRDNLFTVLNGFSGQELKADLAKNAGNDLKLLYNALVEAAELTSGMKLE